MRTPGQRWRMRASDPSHLLDAASAAIDVGRTQFARQQVPAAEYVERQIAVIVVVAVKEAPFLVPVQRVVSGVQSLPRRRPGSRVICGGGTACASRKTSTNTASISAVS